MFRFGSVGFVVELDGLKSLFQLKWIYDSIKHKEKCNTGMYVDRVFILMILKCIKIVYIIFQHTSKSSSSSRRLFWFVTQCWFEFKQIVRKEKVMDQRYCLQGLYLTAGCSPETQFCNNFNQLNMHISYSYGVNFIWKYENFSFIYRKMLRVSCGHK